MELIESVVSGAMGRRIRMATSTASPTEICLAWPAGVTVSCIHIQSSRGQSLPQGHTTPVSNTPQSRWPSHIAAAIAEA